MHKPKVLDALLPKTRQAVLAATLMNPQRAFYLSGLAKHLSVPASSLQRELDRLVQAGILRRHQDGNRVYYQADPDCPLLPELQGLLRKTVGLADVLRQALLRYATRVRLALVFGSAARGEERSGSDVDLLIVGTLGLSDLAPALREAERKLLRPVNPVVYSPEEFAQKLKSGHHLVTSVVGDDRLFLIGNQDELERMAGGRPHPRPHPKQGGAGRSARARRT